MTLAQITIFILAPLIGFLLGGISFGLLIGLKHGVDIRKVGSGNVGATNLGRALGKKYFFQAFFLDALKGFLPVLAVSLFVTLFNAAASSPSIHASPEPLLPGWSPLLTAIACVLGHMFSPYLKFKGGKGVATSLGSVLGFWPVYTLAGLGALAIFLVVFFGWRYISLASIVSAAAFAVLVACIGQSHNDFIQTFTPWPQLLPMVIVAALLAALIIFRHRANIGRLLHGTESKAGQKKSQP